MSWAHDHCLMFEHGADCWKLHGLLRIQLVLRQQPGGQRLGQHLLACSRLCGMDIACGDRDNLPAFVCFIDIAALDCCILCTDDLACARQRNLFGCCKDAEEQSSAGCFSGQHECSQPLQLPLRTSATVLYSP